MPNKPRPGGPRTNPLSYLDRPVKQAKKAMRDERGTIGTGGGSPPQIPGKGGGVMDLEAQVARKVQKTMGKAGRSIEHVAGLRHKVMTPIEISGSRARETMKQAGKAVGDVGRKAGKQTRRNRGPF
jgi:hypothetical protein